MTIQWSLFVPSVLLLLVPADRLFSPQVELRSFDCFRRPGSSEAHRPWWWVPALWLDPWRAFFGASLLRRGLALQSNHWDLVPKSAYVVFLAVVGVAIVAQTFSRRADHGVLMAPIGFVSGITAALAPWPVAVIGVITAFLGLFAFRQFHAYFGFGLVAIGVLGFILEASMTWIGPAVGAFALPLVAGLVTNCTLEFPVRNASGRPKRPMA
ncbi:MAG TPA: hypothetical protein VHE61_17920 [Opitutaceae bacterium]|nr:hypothetical protein [Opitutaceae bacterium]